MEELSPGSALWQAGLSWEALPLLCRVTARTVANWRRRGALPPVLDHLLAVFRDLGRVHPAWSGWQISCRKGELFSPEGVGFRPGDVHSLHWRLQQIRALRRRVAELERELAARPPLPDRRWRPARARRRGADPNAKSTAI